jgi:hypothetical protein
VTSWNQTSGLGEEAGWDAEQPEEQTNSAARAQRPTDEAGSIIAKKHQASALLHQLKLENTGPAPEMDLTLAKRLNLFTGDNRLGKSFLLDTAWYCLTRRWPQEVNPMISGGSMAMPRNREISATLEFTVDGKTPQSQLRTYTCEFSLERDAWVGRPGRPINPGIVLYAMADGSFAVWDPARNAWRLEEARDSPERISPYVFSSTQIWGGLPNPDLTLGMLCNGLIQDWGNWQRDKGSTFEQLKEVLKALSPSTKDEDLISPGPLVDLRVGDTQQYPSILMPDGTAVPVVHASSGVKRILSISYLLIWVWQEHVKASRLLAQDPAKQMIFLIDEAEAHLHPKWQRSVLKALMKVVDNLSSNTSVQLLVVTHSPLVMASVEPFFDPDQDSWWDLDWSAESRQVQVSNRHFDRLGDANSWLQSEAFDQEDTGSIEREVILRKARQVIRMGKEAPPEDVIKMHSDLQSVLGSTDVFWNRWRFAAKQAEWRL